MMKKSIVLSTIELFYYPFKVTLDRCNGSSNIFNDLSTRMCVLNNIEDLHLNVSNMITRIIE